MRVLGIDPGSIIAGFACIDADMGHGGVAMRNIRIVTAGALRFDRKLVHAKRVAQLHQQVDQLLTELNPQTCILERAFCGINMNSALKLGESRGAVISAVHQRGIQLIEIAPRQAKQNITGRGGATKEEVAAALKALIGFELGRLPFDVADALALAMSFPSVALEHSR